MSETGMKDNFKDIMGDLRGEFPSVFIQFMHDLSHELTVDEIEGMLQHARGVQGVDSEETSKTKVKMSSVEGTDAKLKELADEVRGIAQSIEDGEFDLPKDLSEATVHMQIQGKGK